ncbi:23S rRNA (guanosine(2251)-2'-O)-methyltransferase RlmB [Sulfurovum sp. bin170]|uniref:23S rRNA (guanosine(2251)-2'-O)-methyltransferase RlmB n=1 Tax=Sulfurovum sp. bin170 TaxID=2695268 RepID=UPI0013DEE76B|nr:23S rRNA (guanosine(2251)-2'-O)-methyltransferase RlmB [Sulfurovum sp. bin170]NEW60457.1 23S rRNA (guanosine(2251)-2'-O)-methyltransferase RlmB [Sulfurovum sp. bin170]
MRAKDSNTYMAKKAFFDRVITIYGRNAVAEALEDNSILIHKLHFSDSNRKASQLDKMITIAKNRDIEIAYHDKKALSRISKNAKQDQGVALDIVLEQAMSDDEFLKSHNEYRVVVLDGIHNPQNLGMIIRSCAAGDINAIILPTKNSAQISPLVIKASVGTLFRMPIIKTNSLVKTLEKFKRANATLYTLSSQGKNSYKDEKYSTKTLFILGNESEGVSQDLESISDISIVIPMKRGVESLNVAVTASLLAFL